MIPAQAVPWLFPLILIGIGSMSLSRKSQLAFESWWLVFVDRIVKERKWLNLTYKIGLQIRMIDFHSVINHCDYNSFSSYVSFPNWKHVEIKLTFITLKLYELQESHFTLIILPNATSLVIPNIHFLMELWIIFIINEI